MREVYTLLKLDLREVLCLELVGDGSSPGVGYDDRGLGCFFAAIKPVFAR